MKFYLFFFLFTISSVALSYPVFFKCDRDGYLSDKITPKEMSQNIKKLMDSLLALEKGTKKMEEYCKGGATCMEDLKKILQFSEAIGKINQFQMEEELKRIETLAQQEAQKIKSFLQLPEETFDTMKNYEKMISSLSLAHECRVASASLDSDWVQFKKYCLLTNLNSFPYMYSSGLRIRPDGHSENLVTYPTECSSIDELIEGAISFNQDPYAVIAISLMENGTDISGLYLDPIGEIQSLGCSYKKGTDKDFNFYSYGSYFKVNFGVIQNPILSQSILNYLRIKGVESEEGESYLCDNSVLNPTPLEGKCCVKLPFKTSGAEIFQALIFSSLDSYINSPLQKNELGTDPKEYPARRIQRFNGYTDAMGGAEAVSTWRAGVDYYRYPAYGFQSMDFIINTLWNNPYVNKVIKKTEEKLGKAASKSVMCLDKGPGVYVIEHDLFLKKHAHSPRFTRVLEVWNERSHVWSNMPKRFRTLLIQEFEDICNQFSDKYSKFCEDYPKVLISNKVELNIGMKKIIKIYQKEIYPQFNTIKKANFEYQGYNWEPMSEEHLHHYLLHFKNSFTQ